MTPTISVPRRREECQASPSGPEDVAPEPCEHGRADEGAESKLGGQPRREDGQIPNLLKPEGVNVQREQRAPEREDRQEQENENEGAG
jgi:hypothetical protein